MLEFYEESISKVLAKMIEKKFRPVGIVKKKIKNWGANNKQPGSYTASRCNSVWADGGTSLIIDH